jgi:hypothetical protein
VTERKKYKVGFFDFEEHESETKQKLNSPANDLKLNFPHFSQRRNRVLCKLYPFRNPEVEIFTTVKKERQPGIPKPSVDACSIKKIL